MTLVVDPWHWLTKDGELPSGNPRLRRNALRVARVIEYGGTLRPGEGRETLLECTRRPARRPCDGLLVVIRNHEDQLETHCPVCGSFEMLVSNWLRTPWAFGNEPPSPID